MWIAARNKQTDELRTLEVDLEVLEDLVCNGSKDECCGPCRCPVDWYDYCENGWPSRLKAAGIV